MSFSGVSLGMMGTTAVPRVKPKMLFKEVFGLGAFDESNS